MSNTYVAISIAISALVTIGIRFLPFIVFKNGRKTPAFITYLGDKLPYAVMAMLVVYCYRKISFSSVGSFLPALIAGFITVSSYIWKKNTLFSIIIGTVIYMVLVQFVF